MGYVPSKD